MIMNPTAVQPIPSFEKWAFRDIKGSKEDLIAAIDASNAAEHRKVWLKAEIALLDGKAFRLDTQGHSANSGEIGAHLHITKIF